MIAFNSFGLTVFRQYLKYKPPAIGLVDALQPIKNALPLLYNSETPHPQDGASKTILTALETFLPHDDT